jgi:hypothetical protein
MKCPTIRLGISTKCFTYQNDGVDVEDCPSHCASMEVSDALSSPGISYGSGMTFLVTNARILCRSKNGYCDEWTILEAEMISFFLMIYIMVLNHYQFPMMILNFGGTNAAKYFFSHFSNHVSLLQCGELSGPLGPFDMSLLITERSGMHISNLDWRRTKIWNTPEKQVASVSETVFMSGLLLSKNFGETVEKNCQT